jgi:hypothetical protein
MPLFPHSLRWFTIHQPRLIVIVACYKERPMSSADAPPPGSPSAQDLKAALKAFKKRLKLTRLDDESRLVGGPMSKGQGSSIVAITPPNQFSQAVWDALVTQGKLKKGGYGMYELVE